MKRKKTIVKNKGRFDIYKNDTISISREGNEYFFEIGSELTSDVAEAVVLLMRRADWNDDVWDIEVSKIVCEDISPEKSLFWLSGGNLEWTALENYNRPWCDCYLDFQEEFGMLVINIIKKSKTLRDIRDGYFEYLNLQRLYDFALSRAMIRL